jgi:hypothetical protein
MKCVHLVGNKYSIVLRTIDIINNLNILLLLLLIYYLYEYTVVLLFILI